MTDEGLAILRELVKGERAGIHIVWPAEDHECTYCGSSDEWRESWDVEHHPDCPIKKGREYLAALAAAGS